MLQVPDWKMRLRGEVLGREALPALAPVWDDLCARAIEDNVYYSPRYARALIDNIEHDPSLRFAAVWQGPKLIALLPFTRSKIALPFFGTAARAWQTDYTFGCTPLLDRACSAEAAAGLVDLLSTINEGEWIIPTVNAHGAACRAMIEALEKDDRAWQISNAFQRATLEPGGSFDGHMQTHLSSKRRRELARNRRRLEEIGKVAHESHRAGDGLTRAVGVFLKIEASGWKGQRGTALACLPETRQFALDAFTGGAADSICRADVLTLNGTSIAVSLTAFAGGTGFTVKCTYDEAYQTYFAGLLLEVEVIRSFLTERWARRLDAATAGAHVIDRLWLGRTEVADLMFTLAPRHASLRLSALARAVHAKHAAKTAVKALVARVTAD
jgi:CelD/BcsL family acetyltransferase involved in cellulose biosynthesis